MRERAYAPDASAPTLSSRAGADGYVPAVRLGDLPEPQVGYSGPGVLGKRLVRGVLPAASGPLPIPSSGTHPSAPALRLSWVDSARRLRETHPLRRYAARPLRPLDWPSTRLDLWRSRTSSDRCRLDV